MKHMLNMLSLLLCIFYLLRMVDGFVIYQPPSISPCSSKIHCPTILPATTSAPSLWESVVDDANLLSPLLLHVALCFCLAVAIHSWEAFDATNFKSTSSIASAVQQVHPAGIQGMGFGATERQIVGGLRSYNEVLLEHRTQRVPRWTTTGATTRTEVDEAVQMVYQALLEIDSLKLLANDYQWDELHSRLTQPLLRSNLEAACTVLRSADAFVSVEGRREIGFDWGSCAWRHCGALADAQEALDELDHLVGVLEPFECCFCLDIVERSLRDILAVVPHQLVLPKYQPYESQQEDQVINEEGDLASRMEMDYLNVLKGLRN